MAETTPQTLYPTYDSLGAARDAITAQMPLTTANQIHAALMTYHNTLLHVLTKDR